MISGFQKFAATKMGFYTLSIIFECSLFRNFNFTVQYWLKIPFQMNE